MEFSQRWKKIVDIASRHNVPKWRLNQISYSIYKQKTSNFLHMGELPKSLRFALHEEFNGNLLSLKPVKESKGGHAHKVLFETHDGIRIEAVSLDFKTHKSVCISSQAGCAFNCSFCATGKLGLKRQLSVDEITDQVLYFMQNGQEINTISYMGMGEPLANPRVYDSLHFFKNEDSFHLSPRRINVSTIGVLPGIHKLNEEHPQVNLAFSLHSPFNDERTLIMPSNKLYPLEDVLQLCEERIKKTGRRIWIAYLLLEGKNDSSAHAQEILNLLAKRHESIRHLFHINLLPYNKAFNVADDFQKLDEDRVASFEKILADNRVSVSYRNSFGHSIEAACGQLHADYEKRLGKGMEMRKDEPIIMKAASDGKFEPGDIQRAPREEWMLRAERRETKRKEKTAMKSKS